MYLCIEFERHNIIKIKSYGSLLLLVREKISLLDRVSKYRQILQSPVMMLSSSTTRWNRIESNIYINLSFSDDKIFPALPQTFKEKLIPYRRNFNIEELLQI